MIFILTIIFFTLGLIIGSFLNVVIYRMNTARSLGGRSACMSCQGVLAWFELIPVFSFLGLQGRCRNCKTKISIQYPLVELASGLVFAIMFYKLQGMFFASIPTFILFYTYYAAMFSILIVIVVYDLKHKIIPDILSFMFGALAFFSLFIFTANGVILHVPNMLQLLSGFLIALPFFLLWVFSGGRWMGLGDAKLALGLGWFLGLSIALSGIVIAFWVGSIIGIGLMFLKKGYGMKSEIPFAPYLAFGAFIAFVFQFNLFQIYF